MSTANQVQSEKKGGMKTVGIVILSAIIVVLAGVIIYLIIPRQPEPEEDEAEGPRGTVVTPNNVQEVIDQMDQKATEPVPAGYYTVMMNYEWRFATGDAVSENAYVENLAVNTNAVYLDLFLEEDEENAIYKSPVIPLGSSLKDIVLDTPLEAGTYPCVAVYHLVDDDQQTLSTLRVTVTVIVER